jgi:hypothetical protein
MIRTLAFGTAKILFALAITAVSVKAVQTLTSSPAQKPREQVSVLVSLLHDVFRPSGLCLHGHERLLRLADAIRSRPR